MTRGILSFGAYIPRLRLARKSIAEANSWFNAALGGLAKGERSMCNWDEDPVTMAVEASRDALIGRERGSVRQLLFASTTFPFLDRLNSGIVSEALRLPEDVGSLDIAATQRGGTSALLQAFSGAGDALVVAAENRGTKAAGPMEMTTGDGAAALVVGEGDPVAVLLGKASRTADFVDHYRTIASETDYQWEERWIRDAGYMQIVPPVVKQCLAAAKVEASAINAFCMPGVLPKISNAMAKACGIADTAVRDNLAATVGDTGVAHPLMMLVAALEEAKPGDKVLVVGFGQGADALLFEVTPAMAKLPKRMGVKGSLARRKAETSYAKYLSFNDTVEIERGMRAEADKQTALSSFWRNRGTATAFMGGRCTQCGTLQFPKSRICVNPNCNAIDTQEPHPFAEKTGRINSYTADRLTYSPDPPACYGMIQFEEGGRWMMDFTDVDAGALAVGQNMRMMFRVKDVDSQRGFRRYFWKAAPAA